MWQGIQTITNYRIVPPVCDDDVDFLNELNVFFGRFEALNNSPAVKYFPHQDEQALILDIAKVRRSLRSVNSQKALGPDNLPGRVLRECVDQLACVLMDIFNTSLEPKSHHVSKLPPSSKCQSNHSGPLNSFLL